MTEQTSEQTQTTVTPEIQDVNPGSGLLEQVSQMLGDKLKSDGDRDTDARQTEKAADPGDKKPEEEEISDDGIGLRSLPGGGQESDDAVVSELHGLAEKAGIETSDLYKLTVPLDGGRDPVTLGALKDAFEGSEAVTAEREELVTDRTTFQNEMMRAKAEFGELLKLLPEIPPEILQRAQATHASKVETERLKLVGAVKEWADPDTFARVKDGIAETVAEYGFTRVEVESIFDHRLTKLLHDFTTLRGRVREAREKRERVVNDSKLPSRRTQGSKTFVEDREKTKQLNKASDAPMHKQEKLDAVKGLLNGA